MLPRSWILAAGLMLACTVPAWADAPPGPLAAAPPFLWGVTLAGYQNDGAHPAMDWADWERDYAAPRGLPVSNKGADFRGNLDADLDRAQGLGLTAFRTSIEWARMEPEEGKIDAREVAYVHRLLRGLKARGMAPVMTLYHFATPRWLTAPDADGLVAWESPRTARAFARWCRFVATEFGSEIDWYLTFNEPSSVLLGGYIAGKIPPYHVGPVSAGRAAATILAAHEAAYDAIHAADRNARVSIPDYNCLLPVAGGIDFLPGKWLAERMATVRGWDGRPRPRAMDFAADHYYGVNHAFTEFPVRPERWAGDPVHFKKVLADYHRTFGLPILVAENGFATYEGAPRADGWTRESYLVAHVGAIGEARAAGIPVIGYMYWTLTDNYEWGSYGPRFGLFAVDGAARGDYARRETPAAGVYREIIRAGGITAELRRAFPPPGVPNGVSKTVSP